MAKKKKQKRDGNGETHNETLKSPTCPIKSLHTGVWKKVHKREVLSQTVLLECMFREFHQFKPP